MIVTGTLFGSCTKDNNFNYVPPPQKIDTTIVQDTTYKIDTIYTVDTTYISDTVINYGDTIIKQDTVVKRDTIVKQDTVVKQDTIIYLDSIKQTDVTVSFYMDPHAITAQIQGAASFKNYHFQFQNRNKFVFICDLSTKKFIKVIGLQEVSENHCNNISFSNIYYEPTDYFPLLYVSGSTRGDYNHVQVYRILKDNSNFTITKVQEITLPDCTNSNHLYWTSVAIDNEHQYLYAYSNHKGGRITKFEIPSIKSAEIILSDPDILEQFVVAQFTSQQGGVIHNNILYVLDSQSDSRGTNYIRLIDLQQKKDHSIYNLTKAGYGDLEFEGITFYNDSILLITANANKGMFSVKANQ